MRRPSRSPPGNCSLRWSGRLSRYGVAEPDATVWRISSQPAGRICLYHLPSARAYPRRAVTSRTTPGGPHPHPADIPAPARSAPAEERTPPEHSGTPATYDHPVRAPAPAGLDETATETHPTKTARDRLRDGCSRTPADTLHTLTGDRDTRTVPSGPHTPPPAGHTRRPRTCRAFNKLNPLLTAPATTKTDPGDCPTPARRTPPHGRGTQPPTRRGPNDPGPSHPPPDVSSTCLPPHDQTPPPARPPPQAPDPLPPDAHHAISPLPTTSTHRPPPTPTNCHLRTNHRSSPTKNGPTALQATNSEVRSPEPPFVVKGRNRPYEATALTTGAVKTGHRRTTGATESRPPETGHTLRPEPVTRCGWERPHDADRLHLPNTPAVDSPSPPPHTSPSPAPPALPLPQRPPPPHPLTGWSRPFMVRLPYGTQRHRFRSLARGRVCALSVLTPCTTHTHRGAP